MPWLAIAWRVALVVVLGWVVPDRILLFWIGVGFVPFHLARLGTPHRPAAAAALVAFAAALVLQLVSNHVADRQLGELREALVAYHDRTADFPVGDETALEQLGFSTAMGLPGVRRHATYYHSVRPEPLPPMLFYAYAFPFGRHCIDVETGRRFTLD